MRQRALVISALTFMMLTVAGCTMGPNYKRPAVPAAPAYRGGDNSAVSSSTSLGDEKWWALFQDPALQSLIRTAIKQNYDAQIAASRVLQAQSELVMTRANQLPTASAGPSINGIRQPGIPGIFPAYSYLSDALTLSASWNIDFWGRYRRATEAARANLRAADWGRNAVLSTVVENVATAYFELLEYDREIEISRQTLESRRKSLELSNTLEKGGATSLVDVRQAQQLVEQAAATIPQLEQSAQQEENQINLLLGQNPGPVKRGQKITEQVLQLRVPPGLPSQLLERRPDIQESEQNLVAANAEIGVARAQLFPQISLTGDAGLESIGLHNLFQAEARTWNWTASLTQPIFNAGSLRANVRLSEAQKQQALLTYEQSIHTAFREVSDSLIAVQKLREYREHEANLAEYTQDASRLSDLRYRGGATSYLEVLTSETNYFQAELTLARADLNEKLAVIQLYNALGGGWRQ